MAILLCVAHAPDDPGASTPAGTREHEFSKRACYHAAELLTAAGLEVTVAIGTRTQKIRKANAKTAKWDCLLEPHFNASASPFSRGQMAIFAEGSREGKRLARCACRAMEDGFRAAGYTGNRWLGPWPVPSPMVRHNDLPILTSTRPPAAILEYAFASNAGDAVWIDRPDGAELYGTMIAATVRDFLAGGVSDDLDQEHERQA